MSKRKKIEDTGGAPSDERPVEDDGSERTDLDERLDRSLASGSYDDMIERLLHELAEEAVACLHASGVTTLSQVRALRRLQEAVALCREAGLGAAVVNSVAGLTFAQAGPATGCRGEPREPATAPARG